MHDSTHRRQAALPLSLLLLLAAPGATQEEAFAPTLVELAIGAERSGRPVTDLGVADIEVRLDDERADVTSLEPSAEPWQVVLYLESRLSRRDSVRRIAGLLADHADELVSLGEVEIVAADPEPHTLLLATDRVDFLAEALSRIQLNGLAGDELRQVRKQYLELPAEGAQGALESSRSALQREMGLLREQRDRLIAWLAERGRGSGKRLLILADESLGMDPLTFYIDRQPAAAVLAADVESLPSVEELALTLTAFGWTTVPVSLEAEEQESRLQYRPSEDLPVSFRLGFGGDRRQSEAERRAAEKELGLSVPSPQLLAPLAETTGGKILDDEERIVDLLTGLRHRHVLRFTTNSTMGELHRLAVRSLRAGVDILAPSRYAAATPLAVTEARLRNSLVGSIDEGELPVASSLLFDPQQVGRRPARIETQVDFSDVAEEGDGSSPLRLSIAVHREEGEIVFRHELPENLDLEDRQWRHESSVILPSGTDAVAVLVEALASGEWGISFPEFVDRTARPGDGEPRRFVQVLPPDRVDLSRGRVTLQVVTDPAVRRVEYLLNGVRAKSRSKAPFVVKLDLDPARPSNEVLAVAFDRADNELDRDRILLTESADSFWVRIVEPAPGPQAGPVDVEASVRVPEGRTLDRIELYFMEERKVTWTGPPFRRRIRVPVAAHGGYLRAAAYLTDGMMTEDVVLLNRPGFGEQMSVELVELYVVATDRTGIPVRDLREKDFSVLEDDLMQQLESFTVGSDLPLNMGLAIDSSSSLFARLPDVQRAAKGFVRGLIADRDRAFLVGFGMEPEIVQPMTNDLPQLIRGISSLEAYGTTPVWEALVLALTELQSTEGRRALVVFYDGDDEDEDFSYRTCLQLARRARLPIYLIVMNNAAARTEGRSFSSRAFVGRLEKLAEAGGGRVYYVRTSADLTGIFASIAEELRSHYLLTYYPEPGGGPRWRPVEVRVNRRGMEARTIPGYGAPDAEWTE